MSDGGNLVIDKMSHENATHKRVGEVVPYHTLKEETRLESSFSLFPLEPTEILRERGRLESSPFPPPSCS